MTYGEILHFPENYADTDWDTLRESLWFKPKALNQGTDPYETPQTECPVMLNAYSLDYTDAYGSALTYDQQFYLEGEFCQGSIFEIVFKESGDGTTGDANEGSNLYNMLFTNTSPVYADDAIANRIYGSDIRKNFVIGHHQYTPDKENTEIGSGHILPLKWYTPIKDRSIYSDDNGKNRRLIRYVDVVLMYAEALNENGKGSQALEQLNSYKRVVNRINNSSTLYIGGGYGYMRDQIWKQREIELAFEFERFFDIVRQGRAASVLKAFAETRSNHRGLYFREGVNEVFPIPQTEIDISNGVVTQNPGY